MASNRVLKVVVIGGDVDPLGFWAETMGFRKVSGISCTSY